MKTILPYSVFISLIITFFGCRDCPPCPHDVEVPQCFRDMIPYQVGDTIRFRNSLNDTMQFICDSKDSQQNINALQSGEAEGCCPSYMVESWTSNLTTNDGYLMLTTPIDYPRPLEVILDLNDDRQEAYIFNCPSETIDSLKLTQITLYNVLAYKFSRSADTVYVNQVDKIGVVGFKLNGVEWAKVQ